MKFIIYIKNNLISVSPDINYYNDVYIYTDDMYEWLKKYKKLTIKEHEYLNYGCKYIYTLKLNKNNIDLMQYNISKKCVSNVINYIQYIYDLTPSEYESLTGETLYKISALSIISYKLIIQIGKSMVRKINETRYKNK